MKNHLKSPTQYLVLRAKHVRQRGLPKHGPAILRFDSREQDEHSPERVGSSWVQAEADTALYEAVEESLVVAEGEESAKAW